MITFYGIALLIAVCAIWFHFASMQQKNREINRVSSDLAAWRESATQWENYANYLVTLCNSKDIDLYFARANYEVSRDPVAYSAPTRAIELELNGKEFKAKHTGELTYNEDQQVLTLPLMPVANHGSRIDVDSDGRYIFTMPDPVATESSAASEDQKTESGKAQKTQKTSKAKDQKTQKTESSAASADRGSFAASEPNYAELAIAYKTNKKYNEFVSKVKSANKVNTFTKNQINYLLAKFDQWESGKAPNTTDDYAKRVTSQHLANNK